MNMTRLCLIVLASIVFGACVEQQHDISESNPKPDPKVTAVSLSLEKFFAENWSLRDPSIYIAPSPYSHAIPKHIAGKPVEIISEEDLITRYREREVAPELVRINVYDRASNQDIDFCVCVSICGVSGKGTKFKNIPLGGSRTYEFSVVTGAPVLGRIQSEKF